MAISKSWADYKTFEVKHATGAQQVRAQFFNSATLYPDRCELALQTSIYIQNPYGGPMFDEVYIPAMSSMEGGFYDVLTGRSLSISDADDEIEKNKEIHIGRVSGSIKDASLISILSGGLQSYFRYYHSSVSPYYISGTLKPIIELFPQAVFVTYDESGEAKYGLATAYDETGKLKTIIAAKAYE